MKEDIALGKSVDVRKCGIAYAEGVTLAEDKKASEDEAHAYEKETGEEGNAEEDEEAEKKEQIDLPTTRVRIGNGVEIKVPRLLEPGMLVTIEMDIDDVTNPTLPEVRLTIRLAVLSLLIMRVLLNMPLSCSV